MRRYNINDTLLTEKVYDRLAARGWVLGLPNAAIHGDECCPACGSDNLVRKGFRQTKTRRYARYQCADCKAWSSETRSIGGAPLTAIAA
jgi:hypothetical protein